MSILELKSWRTCQFFFSHGSFQTTCQRSESWYQLMKVLFSSISLFLEVEETYFLRQQWMCSSCCVQLSLFRLTYRDV